MDVAMILRRALFSLLFVATVVTSCSLAPRPATDVTGNAWSVPHEQIANPEPWETQDPDHEGISDAVIILSVVALVLFLVAWGQGWITPHF